MLIMVIRRRRITAIVIVIVIAIVVLIATTVQYSVIVASVCSPAMARSVCRCRVERRTNWKSAARSSLRL